jgi:signal transduction histidine kinase
MSIFSVLLGALIFETTGNSQWALIPIAISVASPLLQTAFRTLIQYKSNDFYQRFFAILLFFNGLEYLAYPFLRRIEPLGLTLSISLAHIILFTMSVFLPAFILRNNYKDNIAELEKEVAKRTFSLTEKNRELLELSRENLSLINIVCHDLATSISILNANCFYINIRLTIAEKEKYGSHLEMIQRTLKIINEIFEKVKVLEAVKTGKIHLELTPVNLLEELRESVHLFNDLISEKKLQLRLDCNLPQDTLVLADPVILRNQIINNLISNSIKFSQENGEIEISAIAENNKVYLHIRDHGIGIPAKMLPNLFSFESPTTRQGTKGEKGTGFGLTLVKVCVEKFGGHISVKSETVEDGASDHGSTFIIELKRAN